MIEQFLLMVSGKFCDNVVNNIHLKVLMHVSVTIPGASMMLFSTEKDRKVKWFLRMSIFVFHHLSPHCILRSRANDILK